MSDDVKSLGRWAIEESHKTRQFLHTTYHGRAVVLSQPTVFDMLVTIGAAPANKTLAHLDLLAKNTRDAETGQLVFDLPLLEWSSNLVYDSHFVNLVTEFGRLLTHNMNVEHKDNIVPLFTVPKEDTTNE